MKSTRDTFSLLGLKDMAKAFDAHRGHLNAHREAVRAGLRKDAHIPFPFAPPAVESNPILWVSGWAGSGACYMANTLQRDAVRSGRRVLTLSTYDDRDYRISMDDSVALKITEAMMEEKRDAEEIAALLDQGAAFSHVEVATHLHTDHLSFWPRVVDTLSELVPAHTMLCLNVKSLMWVLDFERIREIAKNLHEIGGCLVIVSSQSIDKLPKEILGQDIVFQGRFCPQSSSLLGVDASAFHHLQAGEFYRHWNDAMKQVHVPLEPVRTWEPAIGPAAVTIQSRLNMLSSMTWRYEPEMAWEFTAKAAGFEDWDAVEKHAARKGSPLAAFLDISIAPSRRTSSKDMEELYGPVTKKWGKFYRRTKWGPPGYEICDFRDMRG
ncbi:hypothetical protein ACGYLO_17940 [Sulfitobacter sp. 1A13353]|uniref:hypothetical protein n=1 Tax=Sulfitobacter sp. 1A13353 TaxID=3368568 RepID=UPI003746B69C